MANLITTFSWEERKALTDLRRWRAKLPVQHTQCAESGYGWRYREGQRWSGPSNRQTAHQNMRWSHTWSAGGRQTAINVTSDKCWSMKYTQTYNSTDTNLQREEDYCKAHNGCDTHCHHHWVSVMEAGNHSHHVGHTEGQDGLKNGKDKYQQLWGVCKDSSQVIKWQNTLKILSY